MRKLAEAHHHTTDEVIGYVAEARAIAAKNSTDEIDAATIFKAVLPLLASKQVLYEQPQASPLMIDGLHNLR